MKLYLLSQDENNGYDTYDSCIVCAENEDDAKSISPDNSQDYVGPWPTWTNNIDGYKMYRNRRGKRRN